MINWKSQDAGYVILAIAILFLCGICVFVSYDLGLKAQRHPHYSCHLETLDAR